MIETAQDAAEAFTNETACEAAEAFEQSDPSVGSEQPAPVQIHLSRQVRRQLERQAAKEAIRRDKHAARVMRLIASQQARELRGIGR